MRLEGVRVAGFFPSPPRVVELLGGWLAAPPANRRQAIRLLDPCCGKGEALAQLGRRLGGESFGVELNEERAAAARTILHHTLSASAFQTRLANGQFSLLLLNPPYDQDAEQRRMEHAFLTALSRALCPGGVLVFLVPRRRLATSARFLAAHYGDLCLRRFPDPEYAAFGQVVLFGRKRARPAPDAAAQGALDAASREDGRDLPPLGAAPPNGPYALPALPGGDVLFASLYFDAAQAEVEARRRGCATQPAVAEQLWPSVEAPVRPLLPLRKGHLALLIAAGMLNNVALTQGDQAVLVKGRCTKRLVEVDTDNPAVEIRREVMQTAVTALDLATGEVIHVDSGGGNDDDD